MRASDLARDLRQSSYIVENVGEYIFGYHRRLHNIRKKAEQAGEDSDEALQVGPSIFTSIEDRMSHNSETINSYNLVKNAIWNCVLEGEDSKIPRSKQEVNLEMLREILLEMNIMI